MACIRRCLCCNRRRRWLRSCDSEEFLTPQSNAQSFFSAFGDLDDLQFDDFTKPLRRRACEMISSDAAQALAEVDASRGAGSGEAELAAAVPSSNGSSAVSASAAAASPWRNCGSPGSAECWICTQRSRPRVTTKVVIQIDTRRQVPGLSLVHVLPSGVGCGAMLTIMEVQAWPRWMPMCQSTSILQRWGPAEVLAVLEFKLPVVGLILRATVYMCLRNRLEEEGFLELLLCSAGSRVARAAEEGVAADGGFVPHQVSSVTSGAGATYPPAFLGVPLPQQRLPRLGVQADVDFCSLRVHPRGAGGLHHHATFTISGEEPCPMDSLISMIWRHLSKNIVAILAKHAAQASMPLAGPRLEFWSKMERQVLAASARVEAAAPVLASSDIAAQPGASAAPLAASAYAAAAPPTSCPSGTSKFFVQKTVTAEGVDEHSAIDV